MPELREVFEMTTKQIEPDLDAWREQEKRQRRANRNKKMGAFAVAATLGVVAIAATGIATRDGDRPPATSSATSPSVTTEPWVNPPVVAAPWFRPSATHEVDFLIDLNTGETTALPKAILRSLGEAPAGCGIGRYAASPDGSTLAFTSVGDQGTPQIFIANVDGTGVRQVTHDPVGATSPAWSPVGETIAYVGDSRDGCGRLYVLDVATGVSTRISDEIGWAVQFTPDGSRILFTARSGLRTMPVEGGTSTPLFGADTGITGSWHGSISPDGSLVTFLGDDTPPSGETEGCGPCRFLANADGTNRQVIHGWEANPAGTWSSDGSRIVAMEFLGQLGRESTQDALDDHEVILVVDVATEEATIVANGRTAIWLNDHTLLVEV